MVGQGQRPRGAVRIGLAVTFGLLAALGCGALPATAAAHNEEPPHYTLKIVEGESTRPEEAIADVNANVSPCAPIRLRTMRGGQVVYEDTGEGCSGGSDGASYSQVPAVGEVVTVESPLGSIVGTIDYDGLPSIEPSVCAGSTNFSGQRSGAETVVGAYYTIVPQHWGPYGEHEYFTHSNQGQAQVTLLSGASFGGSFLTPLALGETVDANESVEVPQAGGAVFTYESETVRPVGACPAPPPPPPPAPPPVIPSLKALILHLIAPHLKALLSHGFKDKVNVNQAATVTQGLYLKGGKLPAFAAAASGHHHPAALLLATGSGSAHAAGTVTIVLRATGRGRSRMRHASVLHVLLMTTIHTSAGKRVNLPTRSLTLHS
jgi:hypothetical protein